MCERCTNLSQALKRHGDERSFREHVDAGFTRTDAPPGTEAKLAAMRQRVEAGYPLHHARDRAGYDEEPPPKPWLPPVVKLNGEVDDEGVFYWERDRGED